MSLLMLAAFARATDEQLPADDGVRIREFYRLAAQIQDRIWPEWSETPAPVLLVTADTEFLTHYSSAPAEFRKIEDDIYARPRKSSTSLLATFPAFGPPAVIVAGEPGNTTSKTSTRWLITLHLLSTDALFEGTSIRNSEVGRRLPTQTLDVEGVEA